LCVGNWYCGGTDCRCKLCVGNWYSGGTGYSVQGSRPAVVAPQASQIPGLGDRSDEASTSDARRALVRDTDSAYVRLAKQGGQRNLLSMESDVPQVNTAIVGAARRHPAGQQKPDWFYDNSGYHNNTAVPGFESQLHSAEQFQGSALQ